jgi:tetratricopeptide (TPR) repeat protein
MKALEAPDVHHLRAAEGWFELGNFNEATEELKHIAPKSRLHPDVLMVRWDIYAGLQNWEFAYTIAQALVAVAPEEAAGWINRSFALHKMKRSREAWANLFPAAKMFPKESTIPYNLACYSCQLGNLTEAWNWLDKAIEIGEADKIKSQAMDDADLKPLWAQLKGLKK